MKAALIAVIVCTLLAGCASLSPVFLGGNLAILGRATQSSLLSGPYESVAHLGLAINAIDGNPDPNFDHGSCSHTNHDNLAWWRLELPDSYNINAVRITVRDVAPERMNGVEILIGNSLENYGNNNPRKMMHTIKVLMVCDNNMCIQQVCAWFPGSAHDTHILHCSSPFDHMDQHVPPCQLKDVANAIHLEDDERRLHVIWHLLAEWYGMKIGCDIACQAQRNINWAWGRMRMKVLHIVVFLGSLLAVSGSSFIGENVALSGRATQSSVLSGQWENIAHLGLAINAVDGNQDSRYEYGSCSHTHNDYSPWWRVDLLKAHNIHSIAITGKNSSPERLRGAEIRIGNSLINYGNNNPRCAYISSFANGETQTFQCHGMVGRYVNIVIPGRREWLTLCEVQVFGELTYENMG